MGARYDALRELVGRYGTIFRHVWARRRELDSPERLPHEAHFLPAALALQETPVHPAPRAVIWVILSFALLVVAWAVFGQIDVVATATGKIVPSDGTKLIQPLESAVVRKIYVDDGQRVKPGDPLVDLDATDATADTLRLSNDVETARFEAERARALIKAIDGGRLRMAAVKDATDKKRRSEQQLLESQFKEYSTKLNTLAADIAGKTAEQHSIEESVVKLSKTAPITRTKAQDLQELADKGFVPRHEYLQAEQMAITQEHELAAQTATLEQTKAALEQSKLQYSSLIAETRRAALDQLHTAEQKIEAQSQELVKAEQRGRFKRLTAPVEGTVEQLAIHTIGGVVTPAQTLMLVVPREHPLEVDAFIANKDIGFVYPQQEARVKIETFTFTKYGTLDGVVEQVSNDAIQDEKLGLVYTARIKLKKNTMQIEGKTVNLTPGMAVTVEIKTGKRRLIEYFLSPLLKYKDESLKER